MSRKTVIPEVITATQAPQKPPRMGLAAELQLKATMNRMATIERIGELGQDLIARMNAQTGAQIERQTVMMERYDSLASRLGPDVTEAYATLKRNAAMQQIQLAHETATTVHEVAIESMDRVRQMPTGHFYTPTAWERLRALATNTHAELLLRPGAPRLSFMQEAKELLVGGELNRIINTYDEAEIRSLQQETLARLTPSAQRPNALPAGEPDEALLARALVEMLQQQQPEPQEVQ